MVKNFAHRGYSSKYPENTMLAFEKAIEFGADGLETDVHFTKDNEIVMIHDECLYRTTGDKRMVYDCTLEEIKKLDASYKDKFGGKFENNHIPTLREYFEMVSKEKNFVTNIEIKTDEHDYPGIEKAVLELIDEFDLRDRIIISSFNPFTVTRFKELAPDVKCGFLLCQPVIKAGKYAKENGVECIHPPFRILTKEYFNEIKQAGIDVNPWTVDEYEDIERLAKLGVDTIISDCPDRVKEVIEKL